MIKIKNLSFRYSGSNENALENVSVEFKKGEITAIIGSNGSGKSTLGLIVANLLKLKSGAKKAINGNSSVGIVFQNPDVQVLFETVLKDLQFVLENRKVAEEEQKMRIEKALEKVGLAEKIDENPLNFSVGQKQRVAIASVLASQPDFIIFDEATSALDADAKEDVLKIFEELRECGFGVVMITNVLDELFIADKIVTVAGKKVTSFETNQFKNAESFETISKVIQGLGFKLTLLWKLKRAAIQGDFSAKELLERLG